MKQKELTKPSVSMQLTTSCDFLNLFIIIFRLEGIFETVGQQMAETRDIMA